MSIIYDNRDIATYINTTLEEHDAKVRADAIDEFIEAILEDMTFIKPTEEQIRRIAEQIKERKNE